MIIMKINNINDNEMIIVIIIMIMWKLNNKWWLMKWIMKW